jgi:molybdate transport system regulatory protein
LRVSAATDISATITHGAVEDLRLSPGRNVMARVKSSLVTLARPRKAAAPLGRNRLAGEVIRRIDGDIHSEIQLDIGDGKILTAVVPKESAAELRIATGDRLDAIFKASDVMLAAD